ncbi:MAG: DNA polymerase III subunit delta [Paludibacteraceae bacterium]|nr:DNA polymerase III subunit delta [Paludibacteraceae bacterium]
MIKQEAAANEILQEIKSKKFHPIYFLMGEEPYYIDKISNYIQENVLSESEKDFDLTILYGKDVEISTVINTAKRFPMIAPYQVVIVKEAQMISSWENLVYYLQKPLKSTILVFCYKYGTPDKRTKWFQETKKTGVIFESGKLYDYQVGEWIRSYIKTRKVGITPEAENMLVDYLGTDLTKIANELDKLLLTKPQDINQITPELVEKNIGISKDYNVFELQKAFVNRDVLKANRIVLYFAENKKNNPLVLVLAQLFNFFGNLLLYHFMKDKTEKNVAAELKINPFFVKDYQSASKIYNRDKTIKILSEIRETDAKSKGVDSASIDEEELLKELVYKIMH